jgi:hypothetical protein
MNRHLLLLSLGLATGLPALACTTCDDKAQAAAAPATAAAAPAAATTGGDALAVVRDAETGQLRAPTAEELAAMNRRQAGQQLRAPRPTDAPSTPLVRRTSGSAVNVRLTPEFASYAVMVRQPDGTLAQRCIQAPDADEALTKAKTALAPAAKPAELK